jgi:hypothetical protein
MSASFRAHWANCAIEADDEILAIDAMEDRIAPLSPEATRVRGLISALEVCHHKAERWVQNVLAAIGGDETEKGLGTRPSGARHTVEEVWQNACAALSAWVAGSPAEAVDLTVGSVPASQILEPLGERSPLKEWQVGRVVERIRSLIDWPRSEEDPSAGFTWLLLGGGEHEFAYREECPPRYENHQEFWLQTARTIIHDTEHGEPAELSLALAIDMLWPCHWRFVQNLQIVIGAIGGNLRPEEPFAACGRNAGLLPDHRRIELVVRSLKAFCGDPEEDGEVDRGALAVLGTPTEEKRWLAASLEKTLRLQLYPPVEVRAMSAMTGPDWIRQR